MADPNAVLAHAADLATRGQLDELDALLAQSPEVLRMRDENGRTLLCLACRAATGDVALPPDRGTAAQHGAIDRILAAGADPNTADNDGWAPLHTAAMSGHLDLGKRLLAAGSRREGRLMGATGGSPLALALFYAQTAMAELLADPPVPDNLRTAAGLGRDLDRFFAGDELTSLATDGLDFDRPIPQFPPWPRTLARQEVIDEALCWAARHRRLATMARLVELGADVNANPWRGTPLLWAVYPDAVESVRWLLDHGADPDLRHDFGGEGHGVQAVALHLAAQYGSVNSLRALLDHGADMNIEDGAHRSTPLGWAIYGGADETARILRDAGAG